MFHCGISARPHRQRREYTAADLLDATVKGDTSDVLIVAVAAMLAAPQPGCSAAATATLERATVLAAEFDLRGASAALDDPAAAECERVRVAVFFVRGLLYATDAFRDGGSAESLKPVILAINGLETIARGRRGSAEIARLLLRAAAAAAQSERDEMRLYLDAALQMEDVQRAVGESGAPLVSVSELAGDLWLQVHRYEQARLAYAAASERVGTTLRVLAGQARTAARLQTEGEACVRFDTLLAAWGSRLAIPAEIAEAREYGGRCPRGRP